LQEPDECEERAARRLLKAHEAAYAGYTIRVKRDFGAGFQRMYGVPTLWGYTICDSHLHNVMPGETWFRTVAEATRAVDIRTAVRGDVNEFWRAWRARAEHLRGIAVVDSHADSSADPHSGAFDAATLLKLNPELDARDFAILFSRAAAHVYRTEPQVGDFVHVDECRTCKTPVVVSFGSFETTIGARTTP
jgi:hypothetical protein